mmetsp:Transcript_32777/g.87990  ORF Transcript_32777/g.87990 Transcript_32777/m.87990 type:complete len:570 (-) Transcript_32777:44-1753(-)
MGQGVSKDAGHNEMCQRVATRAGLFAATSRYHRLPKRIEQEYVIQSKVLGSGFNGVVKLATSRTSDKFFAVKLFKIWNVPREKREQFATEVEIYLAMDHPHIARLVDVYETEEYIYLVMECMEGGELFDRVTELKRFSERDAANTTWQMLLALNYIHSRNIVHRDLKLENFLYDKKGSDHLKLIDFGFSKIHEHNIMMQVSCGTLSYVAPEVLNGAYTKQCDLWSLGVIVFVLLAGYMPFSGSKQVQSEKIRQGLYTMKPERWKHVSEEATGFSRALLCVDPEQRLTAAKALEHPWVSDRDHVPSLDMHVVQALRDFGAASKFRRCCLNMMAWSLSNEDCAKVRSHFIAMDTNRQGTITICELRSVMTEKFQIPDEETKAIFETMDSTKDDLIHYSDFLAAMVSTRIALHDDLLRAAFRKFDTDSSGYITVDNLNHVLGGNIAPEDLQRLLSEADILQDGRISYPEFVAYLRGTPIDEHAQAAGRVIDSQMSFVGRDTLYSIAGIPRLVWRSQSVLVGTGYIKNQVRRINSPERTHSPQRIPDDASSAKDSAAPQIASIEAPPRCCVVC